MLHRLCSALGFVSEFQTFYDNTPPMPLEEAHLGGLFFVGLLARGGNGEGEGRGIGKLLVKNHQYLI